ncbi:MAG: signal recognition particle receptor subunit alpha, partial [Armatimonadaceae bacterium]
MLKRGIFRNLFQTVDTLVTGRGKVDDELAEALEEALLGADLSLQTADAVLDAVRAAAREDRLSDTGSIKEALRHALVETLGDPSDTHLRRADSGPSLYLMVGVNGVGKTTCLGKLANSLSKQGHSVVLAAADTFRAAAAD